MIEKNFKWIYKYVVLLFLLIFNISGTFAQQESASVDLSFTIPSYLKITPITSPVLIANITDRTGNMQAPLMTTFRVVKNDQETRTLYLKSTVITDNGVENSMFIQGNQVYVAFGNLANIPTSNALSNCIKGGLPTDSPGVVAYPVTSVRGGKAKFNRSIGKYEVDIQKDITDVTITVGAHINRRTFASNDPKGFYQAVLSLTETDI